MSEASSLRGLHLHFDGAAGAAGDMTLGALFDLGVPIDVVTEVVAKLGLGDDRLTSRRVVKGGVSAIDVKVRVDEGGHAHAHDHAHDRGHAHAHDHAHDRDHAHDHDHDHDHDHTRYRDVRARLRGAGLDAVVESLALRIFDRVARAEAKLHGSALDDVVFHEVGAIDSLVDIVGAAAALSWLAPVSVSAGVLAVGQGVVRCAHGRLPVPAPATLEILREVSAPITGGDCRKELCTPTGAAILAEVVTAWGAMPALSPVRVGYGAGDRELADRPNVLRAVLGRLADGAGRSPAVYRLEANIDDMNPELCAYAAEAMFAAGALDVWWTPVAMKKSRPALVLSALVPREALDPVCRVVVRETSSIGVRFDPVDRLTLERELIAVATEYGPVEVKLASLDGEVINVAPEHASCLAAAERSGAPLKAVYAAALAAYGRGS
jgi:hypothetical protein